MYLKHFHSNTKLWAWRQSRFQSIGSQPADAVGIHQAGCGYNRTCVVKRSRNQFGDSCFATARPTLWNSFGNRRSLSDNLNDPWKRLCLVSWAASPCVWTFRALTRNLLTYLLKLSCRLLLLRHTASLLFHVWTTCPMLYENKTAESCTGSLMSVHSISIKMFKNH